MELNISHGCFRGCYSDFMQWRMALHAFICPDPYKTLEEAWNAGDYDDMDHPINVLMNHTDIGGSIPSNRCSPLAGALQSILAALYSGNPDNRHISTTIDFIRGLLLAAKNGDDVVFSSGVGART